MRVMRTTENGHATAHRSRRIWALGDAHIGQEADGRDGADWLRLAVDDMRANLQPIDYVLYVGDMTAAYQESELQEFAEIRGQSGLDPWYEVVGNHDFQSTVLGTYDRWIRCPKYWSLLDGNLAIFALPAERCNAAGLFLPEVDAWLRREVVAAAGRNIILCAHSFPYDTVEHSTRVIRCLYPRAAVARFLEEVRVDLWLGGHIHMRPRTAAWCVRKGPTTFLNAAGVSHAYGTRASTSMLLEIAPGSQRLVIRCRHHETQAFLPEFEATVNLPFAFQPGADGPQFQAHALQIPSHYREIELDEVQVL